MFVKFLDEYKDKYSETDFEEPEYLKKDEFRVNKKMVPNRAALAYIEEDDAFESLYKLIVNQFRKIKKRAGGIINQDFIDQFNSVVKEIEDVISEKENKKINESEIPSFNDFKSKFRKKVEYVTEESENDSEDEQHHGETFSQFISDLEHIDTKEIKNVAPLEEENETKNDLKPINIIVGRFQPFHKGHLAMAKELKAENDLPSIAVVVYPGHNKSGKSPFNQDVIKTYMESVVREYPDVLSGFLIVSKGLLGIIAGEVRNLGYRIELIGAGEDRTDDYNKQVDYLVKAGKEFPTTTKIFKTKRVASSSEVRAKLREEDFTAFKKLVPSCVAALYATLVSGVHAEKAETSKK